MADTRNEFKVVVDGVRLDPAQHARINAAIQKAVASALLDGGDAGSAKAAATAGGSETIWASFGRTNGIFYVPFDAKLSATIKSAGIAE